MPSSRYELIVNGDGRKVGSNEGITLPIDWRRDHGLKAGDRVAVRETDDGTLEVIPRTSEWSG